MKKKSYLITIILAICSLVYCLMLIKIILFKNNFGYLETNYNLKLFNFINQYYQSGLSKALIINIIGNILIFVPLGIIIKYYFNFLNNYNAVYIGFIISLSFEFIQLKTGLGIFDIDDLLLNTIGCFIGILIYQLINNYQNKELYTSLFLISYGSISYFAIYKYAPLLIKSII